MKKRISKKSKIAEFVYIVRMELQMGDLIKAVYDNEAEAEKHAADINIGIPYIMDQAWVTSFVVKKCR